MKNRIENEISLGTGKGKMLGLENPVAYFELFFSAFLQFDAL